MEAAFLYERQDSKVLLAANEDSPRDGVYRVYRSQISFWLGYATLYLYFYICRWHDAALIIYIYIYVYSIQGGQFKRVLTSVES